MTSKAPRGESLSIKTLKKRSQSTGENPKSLPLRAQVVAEDVECGNQNIKFGQRDNTGTAGQLGVQTEQLVVNATVEVLEKFGAISGYG